MWAFPHPPTHVQGVCPPHTCPRIVTEFSLQFADGVYLVLLLGLLEDYFVPLHNFYLTPDSFDQKVSALSPGSGPSHTHWDRQKECPLVPLTSCSPSVSFRTGSHTTCGIQSGIQLPEDRLGNPSVACSASKFAWLCLLQVFPTGSGFFVFVFE